MHPLSPVPAAPPEYAGQYPENTMWSNLPAYGYYLRHATNVTFTNCFTSAVAADVRPWIATNDVSPLNIFGPTLNFTPTTTNLFLQWQNNFVLQMATNVTGPYLDVSDAPNPYSVSLATGRSFFRLRQ